MTIILTSNKKVQERELPENPVEDAAFLQENRPSLSLKRKRASADLPAPSSSKDFKRDTAPPENLLHKFWRDQR